MSSALNDTDTPDPVVIGVAFGTLSSRAVPEYRRFHDDGDELYRRYQTIYGPKTAD